MSDSKALDEQWSAEAALSMAYGSLSRATLLHDVGYLESGLQSSYESIVLGDEFVGYARQLMREVPVDEYSLALEEIEAAGPGGNHLGTKYARTGATGSSGRRRCWDHNVHDRWAAPGRDDARRPRARAARRASRRRASIERAHGGAGCAAGGAAGRGAR